MEIEELKKIIRDVPDFPSKGILFRDLTTMIKDGEALHVTGKALADLYRDKLMQRSMAWIPSRCIMTQLRKMMSLSSTMTCLLPAVLCARAMTS